MTARQLRENAAQVSGAAAPYVSPYFRHPDSRIENERSVGDLRPGQRFRCDTHTGKWQVGELLESNAVTHRAVVRLDGTERAVVRHGQEFAVSGHTVRWPYEVKVEPLESRPPDTNPVASSAREIAARLLGVVESTPHGSRWLAERAGVEYGDGRLVLAILKKLRAVGKVRYEEGRWRK